ncbi:hypothetical protein MJD09_20180 [bacterium]|nr:hypothetical protein [bacterium]
MRNFSIEILACAGNTDPRNAHPNENRFFLLDIKMECCFDGVSFNFGIVQHDFVLEQDFCFVEWL